VGQLIVQPGPGRDLGQADLLGAGAGQVEPHPAPFGWIDVAVDLSGDDEAIDQARARRHADSEVIGQGRQARAGMTPDVQQGPQLGDCQPARAGTHLLPDPAHRPGHDFEDPIGDVGDVGGGQLARRRGQCATGTVHGINYTPAHSTTPGAYLLVVSDSPGRVAAFRALHESGCFVIPNPWDVGTARFLAGLGFKALATTSSGFAWSVGRPDNGITLGQALDHYRSIAEAVEVPVNADFEGGFAVDPAAVGDNVTLAAATGVAGLSIEDSTGDEADPLFPFELAVERIKAARAAIDAGTSGVLLTARSEGFVAGRPDLAETIRRLTAFADAGADCLFAPGIHSKADIAAVVRAVAPKPVNVLVSADFTTVDGLAATGVRRISVGGALARAAWAGFIRAATEIADQGTFGGLTGAAGSDQIEAGFQGQGG
jgi:2-methylisocitrate lyase-like PEP mutase family enzyme